MGLPILKDMQIIVLSDRTAVEVGQVHRDKRGLP